MKPLAEKGFVELESTETIEELCKLLDSVNPIFRLLNANIPYLNEIKRNYETLKTNEKVLLSRESEFEDVLKNRQFNYMQEISELKRQLHEANIRAELIAVQFEAAMEVNDELNQKIKILMQDNRYLIKRAKLMGDEAEDEITAPVKKPAKSKKPRSVNVK